MCILTVTLAIFVWLKSYFRSFLCGVQSITASSVKKKIFIINFRIILYLNVGDSNKIGPVTFSTVVCLDHVLSICRILYLRADCRGINSPLDFRNLYQNDRLVEMYHNFIDKQISLDIITLFKLYFEIN